MRHVLKATARGIATLCVLPLLTSYRIRALAVGRDRALTSSSQLLSLLPGLTGQYLRRAFLSRVLDHCAPSAAIEFGVLLSKSHARIDDHVYVGPRCHLGLVHLEEGVLLAPGVQVPSGPHTHGTDPARPIWQQPGQPRLVRIGKGSWIGAGAIVLADVGRDTIVGAGAIVTQPLPDGVIATGVPARVVRSRYDLGVRPA